MHTSDINQLNVFLSRGLEDYERPDSALLRVSSLKQELRKLVAVLYVLFIRVASLLYIHNYLEPRRDVSMQEILMKIFGLCLMTKRDVFQIVLIFVKLKRVRAQLVMKR